MAQRKKIYQVSDAHTVLVRINSLLVWLYMRSGKNNMTYPSREILQAAMYCSSSPDQELNERAHFKSCLLTNDVGQ